MTWSAATAGATGVTKDGWRHGRNELRECAKRLNLPLPFTRVVQRAVSLISRQAGGGERLRRISGAGQSGSLESRGPTRRFRRCGTARGESGQSKIGL